MFSSSVWIPSGLLDFIGLSRFCEVSEFDFFRPSSSIGLIVSLYIAGLLDL